MKTLNTKSFLFYSIVAALLMSYFYLFDYENWLVSTCGIICSIDFCTFCILSKLDEIKKIVEKNG